MRAALTFAVLAVLGQDVVGLAATTEVGGGLLNTVVLTAPVTDGTRVDGWTQEEHNSIH